MFTYLLTSFSSSHSSARRQSRLQDRVEKRRCRCCVTELSDDSLITDTVDWESSSVPVMVVVVVVVVDSFVGRRMVVSK